MMNAWIRIGVLTIGSLAAGCLLPVRIVKIPATARAREAYERGERARREGNLAVAEAHYRKAVDLDPQGREAWMRWIELTRGDAAKKGEIEDRLARWTSETPEDPLPEFLKARLCGTVRHYQAAWTRSGGDYDPILDPRTMSPEGSAGWHEYAELLESLEPATPRRDQRILWSLLEAGEMRKARASLARLAPDRTGSALIRARLAFDGQRREAGWRWLNEADGEAALTREVRAAQLLRENRLGELERCLSAERDGRGGTEDRRPEFDVLEATLLARQGDEGRARALLQIAVPSTLSPRLRVWGALLWFRLDGERFHTPAHRELRGAAKWAPDLRTLGTLEAAFVKIGDGVAARAAIEEKLQRFGDDLASERWRDDLEILALMGTDRDIVRRGWPFFQASSAREQREVLGRLPSELARRVVRTALGHPDAKLRLVALRAVREQGLLAFRDLPAALEADADPRVRASWLVLAAEEGGVVARDSILRGRADADPYVREVANGLSLPE